MQFVGRLKGHGFSAILLAVLVVMAGILWFDREGVSEDESAITTHVIELNHEQPKPSVSPSVSMKKAPQNHRYRVISGDSLEAIFRRMQLPLDELYDILETDEPYLFLDVLQPGDQLLFKYGPSRRLDALSLVVDPSRTIRYERAAEGFIFREERKATVLSRELIGGQIRGSFLVSASRAGLAENLAANASQLLKNKLDFRRDLRAGDRFQTVIERETLDGVTIGPARLLAVRIEGVKKSVGAYLHSDGSYYDQAGNSLTPALLRLPTQKRYRISSQFNPRRLHPVTGRYKPHNGVDFAMPVGVPVIATGNGRVARVANHPFAGKYVDIDQFGPYSSRYLHMSKITVKKGQKVTRGQVIGLSGNTGRSTGPHLHYELHINGRPVNPMTADIPMLRSVPSTEKGAFNQWVWQLQEVMNGSESVAELSSGSAIQPSRVSMSAGAP